MASAQNLWVNTGSDLCKVQALSVVRRAKQGASCQVKDLMFQNHSHPTGRQRGANSLDLARAHADIRLKAFATFSGLVNISLIWRADVSHEIMSWQVKNPATTRH